MTDSSRAFHRWRATAGLNTRIRRWGDGAVAYRLDSGDTVLLDAIALAALDHLAANPGCADELCTVLGVDPDVCDPHDVLLRLEQAGLATRETVC